MSSDTERATTPHDVLDPGITYLQKPVTLDSLTHRIREVLDRSATP
jgi:DNA-binding response OmpR family regulator